MPFPDELAPLAVVPYRPEWPREFERLAALLGGALGELAVSVDHIGSTAVPGLPAKDCVDLQVRVRSLDAPGLVEALTGIGFRRRPEPWNSTELSAGHQCRKLVFAPPPGARSCNVHLREHGAPNARFALLFRDYLRADAPSRRAWGEFKERLAHGVPDLFAYGQVKAPATDILLTSAEHWATATGWSPG